MSFASDIYIEISFENSIYFPLYFGKYTIWVIHKLLLIASHI